MLQVAAVNAPNNQWMLFGFDMRHIGQHWLAAWRDILFSPDSPVRQRLDEPVVLVAGEREQLYQGGAPVEAAGTASCHALLLPDELVLLRRLQIPVAAQAEIDGVLAMETAASSPFTAADTVSGWQVATRDEQQLTVVMAVASHSAIRAWAAEQGTSLEDVELWAADGDAMVVLGGFGEVHREQAYRKRLWRSAGLAAAFLATLLLGAGVFALHQGRSLDRLAAAQAQIQRDAQEVAAMRTVLVEANETIAAANVEAVGYPNPHREIARLTQLLGNDEFVSHFSMRGPQLTIRGRAVDAAQVMQTLAQEPAYDAVTAPVAITALGDSGLEQFNLQIEMAGDDEETAP